MWVVDEITGNKARKENCVPVLTGIAEDYYFLGYTEIVNIRDHCIELHIEIPGYVGSKILAVKRNLENEVVYSNLLGKWILKRSCRKGELLRHQYLLGHGANGGEFIYSFQRNYEAVKSFSLFSGRQVVLEEKEHPLSKYLPYTIGLEYETSQGYLPEEVCFRDGLIPLRDGSITGLEYSSVVLKGNQGLCLLEQQVKSLRKWTAFNKDCSLHIHFGGFPEKDWAVWNLYNVCYRIQGELERVLPPATFKTSTYKSTGKDYCKKLPGFTGFMDLYEGLVGLEWNGNFRAPHPNDPKRNRKWNIHTRYYWVNFINLLCYDINKTIEFRFLRPTYNVRRIKSWIYLFTAILQCAEKLGEKAESYPTNLSEVFQVAYPRNKELREFLEDEVQRQFVLTQNQVFNGDMIGSDGMLENMVYDDSELI